MFVTNFKIFMKVLGEKIFINPSSPEHPKLIEIKNDICFMFTNVCGASEPLILF